MLDYEEALTRELSIPPSVVAAGGGPPPSKLSADDAQSPSPKAFYNTSAHFLWIGDRTRQLTGAHVEYFRGIRNPIGIKVGPSMATDELVRLLDSESYCWIWYPPLGCADVTANLTISYPVVNPAKESGRVTLITRYGAGKVRKFPSTIPNPPNATDVSSGSSVLLRFQRLFIAGLIFSHRSIIIWLAISVAWRSRATLWYGYAIPCMESKPVPSTTSNPQTLLTPPVLLYLYFLPIFIGNTLALFTSIALNADPAPVRPESSVRRLQAVA
jgi:hypothetical protein